VDQNIRQNLNVRGRQKLAFLRQGAKLVGEEEPDVGVRSMPVNAHTLGLRYQGLEAVDVGPTEAYQLDRCRRRELFKLAADQVRLIRLVDSIE
jgi:hypothetical protein